MLVLSRSKEEAVILTHPDGTEVKILIVDVNRYGKVRLGFEAPSSTRIDREEIHTLRKEQEQ